MTGDGMRMHMLSVSLFLFLPVVGLMLSGCSQDSSVPFEVVAHGGRPTAGTVVIESPAQWNTVWNELRGVGEQPEIDWEKHVVIGVFLGERPTGGYSITVHNMRQLEPNRVQVEVKAKSPKPSDFVTMALTYPGQLVQVDRDRFVFPLHVEVSEQDGENMT